MTPVRSLVVAAGCVLAGALVQAQQPGLRVVGLVAEANVPDWRATLNSSRPPADRERLVVVAEDGRVLRVVDGESSQVTLPSDLHDLLSVGAVRATLVHNHPTDRGFSCADLRHLATPGVVRVVAVGSGGSVFEAAVGARYDRHVFEERTCLGFVDDVVDQLASEVGYGFSDRSELADQVPHLLAAALGRLDVIDYSVRPAILARIAWSRNQIAFERVTSRVTRDLARDFPRLAPAPRVP